MLFDFITKHIARVERHFFLADDVLASDSEMSGSDEDEESDTLSESSGSENRLSQEELSSQDDDSPPENNLFSSNPEKSGKPITESPPSIAVASLQDLSNKMFQVRPVVG